MSPITFGGDILSSTERVQTKSWSLNQALRDVLGNSGWPLRSLAEIYGPKGIGKTSFSLDILGTVAQAQDKGVSILDFEIQENSTVQGILENTGFDGEVTFVRNQGSERPEETVERFCDRMYGLDKKAYANPDVGLMDSIGAFRPMAELEGKIGDANMGIKAREMGQISSRFIRSLQLSQNPGTIFMTNHEHPNMSIGFNLPPITSGGETKKYLSQIRIRLSDAYIKKGTIKTAKFEGNIKLDGMWLMEGKVNENRFGISDQKFWAWMVGGEGIHSGLTSIIECLIYGYAEASAAKLSESTTISLDGKSYGKLGKIIRDRKDDELFVPFQNSLRASSIVVDDTESESV